MGSFGAGTRELGELVGDGELTMKVEVDQIYALAIESGYWRSGPLAGVTNRPRHGGKTHFLRDGLHENAERYMRKLARAFPELEPAMVENAEDLARQVFDNAPRDKQVLRNSAHPTVTSGHVLVYDRPPAVHRLTEAELRRRGEFVPR